MDIKSLEFIGLILTAMIAYNAVGSPAVRQWIFFAANAVFLASFAKNYVSLLPFLLFLAFSYALILLLNNKPGKWTGAAGVAAVIAGFIYLKNYSFAGFLPSLPFPFVVVGLSYILFRVLHLIIDVNTGAIRERISPLSYFNYTCSLFTFVSGPIQLYPEFKKQAMNPTVISLSRSDIVSAVSRLLNGYFKIMIFSVIFLMAQEKAYSRIPSSSGVMLIAMCIISASAYTIFLYFNFSGYVDVVISLGRFFGFDLPENFTKPFTSENFIDFWSKWHITLSSWFKIYMFNPLLKFMLQRWPSKKMTPYYGVIGYFATFLVLGLWHSSVWSGIFFGVGAGANKLYETEMRARLGKKRFSRLEKNVLYRYCGRGFNFAYVSFSLTWMWMGSEKFFAILQKMGVPGTIGILVGVSLLAACMTFLVDIILKIYTSALKKLAPAIEPEWSRQLWLAIKLFLIVFFAIEHFSLVPDFVYKGF